VSPIGPAKPPLPADPDLALVVDSWHRLPEPIRAGILAMVKAASGEGGGR
jgi:hypothetical protein